MPAEQANLSPEFIAQQHKRLEALRQQVLGGELSSVAARRSFAEEHGDEAREFEEEAQDSAQEEIRQAERDIDATRISHIERALQKIDDGSYGLSDLSGKPIPKARLEATPEAILTVEEEQAAERKLTP
ncbi:MAG TPA: TraR/DksA family transcriptional regulator [Dyella sp.]|uniref:TraR/DksA family transcriptional regulator n=1 Tax=Dyella sp. TaxID=1869338 RepID=UPI002D78F545|nr:TraR/DksA family transcriptional regulator [Dyella sp.]HET6555598.1 TraR/DksA family transcriptional regulator [Dyella sp.]